MTTFDAQGRRHLEPPSLVLQGPQRVQRLQQLGLEAEPQPLAALDELIKELAKEADVPDAMVNLLGVDGQHLVGLHSTTGIDIRSVKGFQTGMCPHVVARGKVFPLHNVHAFPRFAGNPVVDAMGVVAYLGAPLRLGPDELVSGSVCFVDSVERDWGNPGVAMIKDVAHEVRKFFLDHALG